MMRGRAREIKRQERDRKERLEESVREELWSAQGGKKGRALLSSSLRSPVGRRVKRSNGAGDGGEEYDSASASKASSSSSSSSSSYKASLAREKAKAVQSLRERYAREKKRRAQQKTT